MNHIHVVSKIDGKSYQVKNDHLAQESADILATINQRISLLKTHIEGVDPKPEYTSRLAKHITIGENILNLDTAFTMFKKNIYFCLTPKKKDANIYDINTLMYIALHELAHVCSKSSGHTREFKLVYKDLLQRAIDIGVYEYVDYTKYPVDYCGLKIEYNMVNLSGWDL